jgi:hypothetical protein
VAETHQPGQVGGVISVAKLPDENYQYTITPKVENPQVTLNPDSEFERALTSLVKTHREKSKGYGSESDPFQNFYDNAWMNSISPLLACEVLLNKHQSYLRQWRTRADRADPGHTEGSDDAMLDRAVYSVIALCLYRREEDESATQEG